MWCGRGLNSLVGGYFLTCFSLFSLHVRVLGIVDFLFSMRHRIISVRLKDDCDVKFFVILLTGFLPCPMGSCGLYQPHLSLVLTQKKKGFTQVCLAT